MFLNDVRRYKEAKILIQACSTRALTVTLPIPLLGVVNNHRDANVIHPYAMFMNDTLRK